MATLTTEQRTDLLADLDLPTDETVFTNDELDRLWTRVNTDLGEANLAALRVYALRQLVSGAARLFNYTVGQTKVQRRDVRRHLMQDLELWKKEAGLSGGVIVAGTIDLDLDEAKPVLGDVLEDLS